MTPTTPTPAALLAALHDYLLKWRERLLMQGQFEALVLLDGYDFILDQCAGMLLDDAQLRHYSKLTGGAEVIIGAHDTAVAMLRGLAERWEVRVGE
jgi:hypothetical protein